MTTEIARVAACVLALGTASQFEVDDWNCLPVFSFCVIIESKYGGCLDKGAW